MPPPDEPDTTARRRPHYRDGIRVDLTVDPGVPSVLSMAELVRTLVQGLRAGAAPRSARIGLTLTDDTYITRLNEQHMGHEGATDVLSFPLLDPGVYPAHAGQEPSVRAAPGPVFVLPPGMRVDLGDIVVSVERAVEQAEQGRGGHTGDVRWSAADELRLLVIHGALHICGWDHVLPAEEAAMRSLERQLLSGVAVR